MRKLILLLLAFGSLALGLYAQDPVDTSFDFAHDQSGRPIQVALWQKVGASSLGKEMWIAPHQEAGLTTPITRTSESKYKIRGFQVVNPPGGTVGASIDVSIQDSTNAEIRVVGYQIPDATHPGATVPGLITAMMTIRATETGTDSRKMQFRVLGYFADQGYFPAATLVP